MLCMSDEKIEERTALFEDAATLLCSKFKPANHHITPWCNSRNARKLMRRQRQTDRHIGDRERETATIHTTTATNNWRSIPWHPLQWTILSCARSLKKGSSLGRNAWLPARRSCWVSNSVQLLSRAKLVLGRNAFHGPVIEGFWRPPFPRL